MRQLTVIMLKRLDVLRIGLVLLLGFFLQCKNQPPSIPVVLGPQRGRPTDTLGFSALSVDREGDSVSYLFDWEGRLESNWSEWLPSGREYYRRVTFPDTGRFFLRVKARDRKAESGWSDTLTVDIRYWTPQTPHRPSGPDTAFCGDTVTFVSWALHPLNQAVALQFDWGDTLSPWGNFLPPGTIVYFRHTYIISGFYEVRCRAADRSGYISDWSLPETILVVDTTRIR